jgi:capsular polysaccharide transport system permease protein
LAGKWRREANGSVPRPLALIIDAERMTDRDAKETLVEERPQAMLDGRPFLRPPTARRGLLTRIGQSLWLPHGRAAPASEAFAGPKPRGRPYLWSFVALVLLPALCAACYFAFIASDQYQAEARFAVRTIELEDASKDALAASATAAGGTGGSSAASFSFTSPSQNAHVVTSYIRSRAIVDDIGANLDLREIFRRPGTDFWARLQANASIDELTDYWSSMIGAYVDPTSGIVTVTVNAFTPDDAKTLGDAILQQSERLVNRIADRARHDATALAEKEVRESFAKVQQSLETLRDFRNKSAILDPGQSVSQIGKLLLPMMAEKVKLEIDLAVGGAELAPDAPSQRITRNRLASLDKQIADLRAQLTGEDSRAIATALAKYEELDMQRVLNERYYGIAQSDLERAHLRSQRQSIYFSTFIAPSLPEYARLPYRIANSLLFLVTFLVLWGIGAMTCASIEDHRL